jgi:hypothetical protein
VGFEIDELAAAGPFETFGRGAIGFNFRHDRFSSVKKIGWREQSKPSAHATFDLLYPVTSGDARSDLSRNPGVM